MQLDQLEYTEKSQQTLHLLQQLTFTMAAVIAICEVLLVG